MIDVDLLLTQEGTSLQRTLVLHAKDWKLIVGLHGLSEASALTRRLRCLRFDGGKAPGAQGTHGMFMDREFGQRGRASFTEVGISR